MPPIRLQRPNSSLLATAALLALGVLPADSATTGAGRVRDALRNDLPNRADFDQLERGYYEQILDANRVPGAVSNAVAGALAGHAETFEVEHDRLTNRVDDLREYVLKPNMTHDPGRRIPWSTNRLGMRDREYSETKPPHTYRVALVGDSIAAGWGVSDEQVFEARIEVALDATARGGRPGG